MKDNHKCDWCDKVAIDYRESDYERYYSCADHFPTAHRYWVIETSSYYTGPI